MNNLKGKKLLILGGDSLSSDIVLAAKEMEIYTIVADWYDVKRSPAKLLADEYWDEDIFNTEKIVQHIKEHRIDGVITGFTDSYLLQYNTICEKAGLPCYATKDVFEITLDKSKFKALCRMYNVPVIPEYNRATFDPNCISEKHKIIIKPVDNSGSRGVTVCNSPSNYDYCLKYALSFSASKKVVIERYLEMDSFAASYTLQNGIISLSTLNDRLVHKAANGSDVTCAGIYPSKYIDAYLDKLDKPLKNMYQKLGAKNGVLSVQGFSDGTNFYVMEMGYRLTGGQHYIFSKQQNGISALEMLIHFAITGQMANYKVSERDNARFKEVCCQLYFLGKEGVINKIEGEQYVKKLPETVRFTPMKRVGDSVGRDGTSAQKIATVHLASKSQKDLEQIARKIKVHYRVLNTDGDDLVLEFFK